MKEVHSKLIVIYRSKGKGRKKRAKYVTKYFSVKLRPVAKED